MKKRLIVKAKCSGFGSEMRSALCPIEHGCVYFLVGGYEMVLFTTNTIHENDFSEGKEYDISFIPKDRRTLSYPKIIK